MKKRKADAKETTAGRGIRLARAERKTFHKRLIKMISKDYSDVKAAFKVNYID